MAKLPSSFREQNRTSESYRRQYANLPPEIQEAIRDSCAMFDGNPAHPSLRHHELRDTKNSHHCPGSFSVSITLQYRAIYTRVDGINVWYWVGTHADYKQYTDSKR